MKKALLLAAVLTLALAGCSRQGSQPGAPSSPPPAASTPSDSASVAKAATANQESAGETPADRGDASLERMTTLPDTAQLPAGRWKPGVNYKPVVPAQGTSAEAGQVEVMEVFWYGCPHCYALDPYLESWRKNGKAPYVKFVRVPVMWGPVHRQHARLFYTLQALGKIDALHTAAFDAVQHSGNLLVDSDDATTLRLQLAFATANGIKEADFTREYNGFFVNSNLQHAEDVTRRYRVEGVPLIVINGKYQTDVGMAGGHEQLIQLINDLAASEKRR